MDFKEKPTFKQSEVGLIPKDWEVKEIGEISSYINRGISPKYSQEGIPVLNQKCVRNGKLEQVDIKFHNSKETFSKEKIVVKDDILINSTGVGTLGRAANVKSKISCLILADSHVTIVRIDQTKADAWFVAYYLNSIQSRIEDMGEGTSGQQELSRKLVKTIKIPFPNITEQKIIAQILSHLDEKIELNQQMNKTLEAVGQAVFKRWFVDFEFPNEEGKPYKSSGREMIYNSALDKEIPAKWVTKEIGELAKINERSINRDFKYSEIEYIDIDSVDQGVIRNPQILQLADAPSRAKRIVKNQDIIISTVRPNLKHFAFIQKATPNTIVSTGFAGISPNKGNSKFLYYHLTADKCTNYLSAIADAHTSTYPSFNPDIIQKSVVAYPGEKEQVAVNLPSRFDLILEGLFCKVENNSKQISTLTQLRDILLPKLMSGKIRVPIDNKMEIQ